MCRISVGLAHNYDGIIPSTWLLLNTCSTTSVGNNPDMFKKFWECLEEEILILVTNGEKNHSIKLASMNYFQLRRTLIYIQWPTYLHLRICMM